MTGSGQNGWPGFYSESEQGYVPAINAAGDQAGVYNGFAAQAAANTQAPTITNQYAPQTAANLSGVTAGQNTLGSSLQAIANNGYLSPAEAQYQAGVNQGVVAQNAIANSSNGGGQAALARRGALQNAASQASAAGGAAVAAQAQGQAQDEEGVLLGQEAQLQNTYYGQNQASALAQAQLQQRQQSLANAGLTGFNTLTNNELGMEQNNVNAAAGQLGQMEGLGTANQAMNYQNTQAWMGTGLQGGTGLASIASGMGGQQNTGGNVNITYNGGPQDQSGGEGGSVDEGMGTA
jgi:hypothetical protein